MRLGKTTRRLRLIKQIYSLPSNFTMRREMFLCPLRFRLLLFLRPGLGICRAQKCARRKRARRQRAPAAKVVCDEQPDAIAQLRIV